MVTAGGHSADSEWLACWSQFSGTLQLAALAPPLVIFNAFQYTLNALSVATVRCGTSISEAASPVY